MNSKYLSKHFIYSIIIGSLSLSACGGGGDTGTPTPFTPASTAFKVNVQIPDGLNSTKIASLSPSLFADYFISTAAAATVSDALGAGNFTVAIVNAAGVVTDIVSPESISQQADGSWVFTLADGTRVDCVIIADISKTPNVVVGRTLPADTIYAPTAAQQFDIDIRSTTAYQEFIAAVADSLDLESDSGFTDDDIAALVETAQTLPLPSYTPGQTLEEYLEAAIPELETDIEREIVVINNSDSSFKLADYVENGGVLNWFYGVAGLVFERGQFSYDANTGVLNDSEQNYNNISGSWDSHPVTAYVDALIPGPDGWSANAGLSEIDSFNPDGSITLQDTAANNEKELIAAVKIDLAGLRANLFAPGFKDKLADSVVFSAGAEAYLLSSTTPVDIYKIWAEGSGDFIAPSRQFSFSGPNISSLDEIFSATAATSTDPDQINLLQYNEVMFELVGSGSSGTANIYAIDYAVTPFVATVIESSRWQRKTVNGKDLVIVDFSGLDDSDNISFNGESPTDTAFYLLTMYNGQLVEGEFIPADDESEESIYLFNDIAAQDINDNFALATTAPTGSLNCSYNSTWDDFLDQPSVFNSYTDFETVLSDCGNILAITDADITGTWVESYSDSSGSWVETIVFNANGSGNWSEAVNGAMTDSVPFTWTLGNNRVTMTVGNILKQVAVLLADGSQKFYNENSEWITASDLILDGNKDGEIWSGSFEQQ